eukprot:364528-Chlamydomonas_euryale.AAC.3
MHAVGGMRVVIRARACGCASGRLATFIALAQIVDSAVWQMWCQVSEHRPMQREAPGGCGVKSLSAESCSVKPLEGVVSIARQGMWDPTFWNGCVPGLSQRLLAHPPLRLLDVQPHRVSPASLFSLCHRDQKIACHGKQSGDSPGPLSISTGSVSPVHTRALPHISPNPSAALFHKGGDPLVQSMSVSHSSRARCQKETTVTTLDSSASASRMDQTGATRSYPTSTIARCRKERRAQRPEKDRTKQQKTKPWRRNLIRLMSMHQMHHTHTP